MNNISIETIRRVMKLRTLLQRVSTISYAYSKLNGLFPIDNLDEEGGLELKEAYEELLDELTSVVKSFKAKKW